MNKLLLVCIILSMLTLGCGVDFKSKSPDTPIQSNMEVENGSTAINVPFNITDSAGIINIIYILFASVVCLGVLTILFVALWQKNSRRNRRRLMKNEN